MRKKSNILGKILIVLGIIALLLFVFFLFFYKGPVERDQIDGSLPVVPFGPGSDPQPESPVTVNGQPSTPIQPPSVRPDETEQRQLLWRLTDFPVTNFGFFSREKEILQKEFRTIDVQLEDGSVVQEQVENDVLTKGVVPVVMYNRLRDGHVFETELFDDFIQTELTNTYIQLARDTQFGRGQYVLYRYYNDTFEEVISLVGGLTSNMPNAQCPYPFNTTLKQGDTGREVEFAQVVLGDALLDIQEPIIFTPGVYDDVMQGAVRVFQETFSLATDGSIGPMTNSKLAEVCVQKEQLEALREIANDPDYRPYTFLGKRLDLGVTNTALSPGGQQLVYSTWQNNKNTFVIYDFATETSRDLFSIPYSEWIMDWPNNDTVTAQTKASGLAPGYFYKISVDTGQFSKLMGPYQGLLAKLSPTESKVLMSTTLDSGRVSFKIRDLETYQDIPTTLVTFPEKCVWEPSGEGAYCASPNIMNARATYPDDWYMGIESFNDSLWYVDVTTGQASLLNSLTDIPGGADIIEPKLSPDMNWFIFINKKTGELWALDLRTDDEII